MPETDSASIARTAYALTPQSGAQFLDAETAARLSNIQMLADGDGMIYTSAGQNLARALNLAVFSRFVEREYPDSHDLSARIEGGALVLSPGTVVIGGELLSVWGPAGGEQRFPLTELQGGRHALVIEMWRSLAGVSTLGKAHAPAFTAGVSSPDNKPHPDGFYRAGNLAASERVEDRPFVTATVESQRPVQLQYALRLVPDADLRGTFARSAAPPDRAGTLYAGEGDVLHAFSPPSITCADVALDRRFTTAKLLIVDIEGAGARIEWRDPWGGDEAPGVAQRVLPRVPAGPAFRELLRGELDDMLALAEQHGEAIRVLQAGSEFGVYTAGAQLIQANTNQRVFFTGSDADPMGWHDGTTLSNRMNLDFSGAVAVTAHLSFAASGAEGLDGHRGAALFLGGEATGVEVRQLAGGGAASVQVSGELEVSVGDYLEVAALHGSENTALSLQSARLTVRRLR